MTICLSANTIATPWAGGLFWAYSNWALGLKRIGCRVLWLETITPTVRPAKARAWVEVLRSRLEHHQLQDGLSVVSWTEQPLPAEITAGCLDLDAAAEADLLINQQYGLRAGVVSRFRRSALLDLDPGQLQVWMAGNHLQVAPHDHYFTIGETVGQPGSRIPHCGLPWGRTPPCVSLEDWPECASPDGAPFTCVSSWDSPEWMEEGGESYRNDKAAGFEPVLDLPRLSPIPLELALSLAPGQAEEQRALEPPAR